MIDNRILLLSAITLFPCFDCGGALAAEDSTPTHITINQIVSGEGKPGDTATSQNGEVTYRMLEGGIIEVRNTRYKTTQRYSFVKPKPNSRNN